MKYHYFEEKNVNKQYKIDTVVFEIIFEAVTAVISI